MNRDHKRSRHQVIQIPVVLNVNLKFPAFFCLPGYLGKQFSRLRESAGFHTRPNFTKLGFLSTAVVFI